MPDQSGGTVRLAPHEEKAIRSLRRLAKTWPRSLMLFSQSGSLYVAVVAPNERAVLQSDFVAYIEGIPNDGGDADA